MSGPTTAEFVFDGLVAFGTIAVAVLAIWGPWIRSILAPAKLKLILHTPRGNPTVGKLVDGKDIRLMYFHLKVVNQRPWLPAENCRVLLKSLTRRGPDGLFHPVSMAVPLQFVWAPSEITPPVITISKEQVLDFGRISEGENRFVPQLYSYSNNFQGFVGSNDVVRFHLEIDATNYSPSKYQVFEVAWDGQWNFESEQMAQHLRIREVEP